MMRVVGIIARASLAREDAFVAPKVGPLLPLSNSKSMFSGELTDLCRIVARAFQRPKGLQFDMDFVAPLFNKGQIDRAGDLLCSEGNPPVFIKESLHALLVAENWRASHSYPMQVIRNNLANRAKKVATSSIVAQRLKRFESIVAKLQREPRMKLSQMQDLGGCRAIMPSVDDVDELLRVHQEAWSKAPHRHELHRCKDYIAFPKKSGYRGIHLVYKFKTDKDQRSAHNGQRIEVQIRSRLQHAWATAVEIVGSFQTPSTKVWAG